jgi:hypothetical protein
MPDPPAVSTWVRLEPRRETADPTGGLAARLADPLWLLARQLQLGEFTGDDGGMPVQLRIDITWVPFTHWLPGDRTSTPQAWEPYDGGQPLEALVEDDRALVGAHAPPLLAVVEAGQRLDRALRHAGLTRVSESDALTRVARSPHLSADAQDIHADRTIDGFVVRAKLDTVRSRLEHGLGAAQKTKLHAVIDEWQRWFDGRFGFTVRQTAWNQPRLEHRFSLAAPHPDGNGTALVFDAPEYLGSGIDWTALQLVPGADAPPDLPTDRALAFTVTASYPQPLRWPGMPVDRFWEMEDGTVDLGSIHLDAADLAGLLALDVAVTASTDWFVIEAAVPSAGVARIDRVTVVDVMLDEPITLLERAADAPDPGLGALFASSARDRSGTGWLVLPPRSGARVDGTPREEILLVRDELANLGWIVERLGPLVDGEPAELRPEPLPVDAPSADGSLTYRLSSGAPRHWHPLVPARREFEEGGPRLVFARGQLFDDVDPFPTTVLGQELDELLDEEVPREGKRIARAWQYSRWIDGSRHLWSGRTVDPGRGEASSALRFDITS